MVPDLRARFNAGFTTGRHQLFLDTVRRRCGVPIEFPLSETPCFLPASLLASLEQAARAMIESLLGSADYLRRAAEHFGSVDAAHVLEAAGLYEQVAQRLGSWDAKDPIFGMVKQQPLSSWTADVRRREVALLRDVQQLEERAMRSLEQVANEP